MRVPAADEDEVVERRGLRIGLSHTLRGPPYRYDARIVNSSGFRVLGQFASPYFVPRSPGTLNVQGVRLASLAPSCLVWLAT